MSVEVMAGGKCRVNGGVRYDYETTAKSASQVLEHVKTTHEITAGLFALSNLLQAQADHGTGMDDYSLGGVAALCSAMARMLDDHGTEHRESIEVLEAFCNSEEKPATPSPGRPDGSPKQWECPGCPVMLILPPGEKCSGCWGKKHDISLATETAPPGDEAPALTISQAVVQLNLIMQAHGDLILNAGGEEVREIVPVIWLPEEQAREGGELRPFVML